MYKSKLFSSEQGLPKPSNLWAGERERSLHAEVFSLQSSLLVENLVDSDEDKLRSLQQEVADFEKGVSEAGGPMVARMLQKHDMYELAQRMTTRLRVLLGSNHELAEELDYGQHEVDEKVRQLEQDIVEW